MAALASGFYVQWGFEHRIRIEHPLLIRGATLRSALFEAQEYTGEFRRNP
jgi:hypothetical protein